MLPRMMSLLVSLWRFFTAYRRTLLLSNKLTRKEEHGTSLHLFLTIEETILKHLDNAFLSLELLLQFRDRLRGSTQDQEKINK